MQITCRNCGKPVSGQNVNIQSALAKCDACHAVFAIGHAPGMAPAGAPGGFPGGMPQGIGYGGGQRPAVPMPDGMSVETLGSELVIHRSWFTWVAIFLALFATVWLGISCTVGGVFLFGAFTNIDEVGAIALPFMLIPLLFICIGVGIGYFALCSFVNTTTIRVARGELSVSHGPLPWFGNTSLPIDGVAQFFCSEQVHYGKRGSVSFTYSVEMVLKNGARQTLCSNLTDATQALFIEQELERHLGIVDQPVGGELRRW